MNDPYRHVVTGKTRMFAIVADPIHHVQTPQAINAIFAERRFDGLLVPLHVRPADLAFAFENLRRIDNLGGLIVTVPHKEAAVDLCDRVGERARRIGAVNVVRRNNDGAIVGENFDGLGFLEGLLKADIHPENARIYLTGVGGAGKAIAFSLAERCFRRLTIHNRSIDKADALCEALRRSYPSLDIGVGSDARDHDLVINATSLGLREDDALPVDPQQLRSDMTVAEVIMEPAMTPLLSAAAAVGCRVHGGHAMLSEQINMLAGFLIDHIESDGI